MAGISGGVGLGKDFADRPRFLPRRFQVEARFPYVFLLCPCVALTRSCTIGPIHCQDKQVSIRVDIPVTIHRDITLSAFIASSSAEERIDTMLAWLS